MIDMNLVNSPSYIVGPYPGGKAGLGKGLGVFLLIVALVVIPVSSVALVNHLFYQDKEISIYDDIFGKRDSVKQELPKAPQAVLSAIENIMAVTEPEVEETKAPTDLQILIPADRDRMSGFERMNFEVRFTPLLLEEFTRIVPRGITFNSIRIFNFETVIAEGTSPNRELVTAFLSAFRENTQEWDLKPRPQTTISAVGNFYEFRLEANFNPATTKIIQNPIDPDGIPTRLQLDDLKNRIVRLVRSSGLQTQGLILLSSLSEPGQTEFRYNLNFNGTFLATVDFLRALSLMREPIKSQNLVITNTPQGNVNGNVIIQIRIK